jgi:hypothetical protein
MGRGGRQSGSGGLRGSADMALRDRPAALVRLGGEFIYLDADNATDLNVFADYIRHSDSRGVVPRDHREELAFQSSQGVFETYGNEGSEGLMREYARISGVPFHSISTETQPGLGGGAWGSELVRTDKGEALSEKQLLEMVGQPGVFFIRQSDISAQDNLDDPKWSRQHRDHTIRRRLLEVKHPDAIIVLNQDWRHGGDIKAAFQEGGSAISLEPSSPGEFEHLRNEVHRVALRDAYHKEDPRDIDGSPLSEERWGLHSETPRGDVEEIISLPGAPFPVDGVGNQVSQEGTYLIIGDIEDAAKESLIAQKHPDSRIVFLKRV